MSIAMEHTSEAFEGWHLRSYIRLEHADVPLSRIDR